MRVGGEVSLRASISGQCRTQNHKFELQPTVHTVHDLYHLPYNVRVHSVIAPRRQVDYASTGKPLSRIHGPLLNCRENNMTEHEVDQLPTCHDFNMFISIKNF